MSPAPPHIPGLLVLACAGLALLGCQERELNEVDDTQVARITIVRGSNVRPVDVLFVVDDSESMCAEQLAMADALDAFVGELVTLGADLRLAVTTTDMADPVDGNGHLRTAPGVPACDGAPPPTDCPALDTDRPWLELDATSIDELAVADFVDTASCLLQVGRGGSGIEMGLGAARAALERHPDFVRDEALLVVVFVSDANDCSDGTRGTELGPVYEAAIAAGTDSVCEQARNLEDSCPWTADDPGPTLTHAGASRTAFEWCVAGVRDTVDALGEPVQAVCPESACQNELITRTSLLDFLTGLKPPRGRESAPDVLIAALVHPDDGARAPTTTPSCDPDGRTGYRYTLLAQMLPDARHAIHGLCEGGAVVAAALAESARRAAELVEGVCLHDAPRVCSPQATASDGECLERELCCPDGQRCDQGPYAGADGPFYLCSGFRAEATLTLDDGPAMTLGPDEFRLTPGSPRCPQPFPLELELTEPMPAGGTLVVTYPGRLWLGSR